MKKILLTVALVGLTFSAFANEPRVFQEGEKLGLMEKTQIKKLLKNHTISEATVYDEKLEAKMTFDHSAMLKKCYALSKEYKQVSTEEKLAIQKIVKSVAKDPSSVIFEGFGKASAQEQCEATTPYQATGDIYITHPKGWLNDSDYSVRYMAVVWKKKSVSKPIYVVRFNAKNSYGAYNGATNYWIFENGDISKKDSNLKY